MHVLSQGLFSAEKAQLVSVLDLDNVAFRDCSRSGSLRGTAGDADCISLYDVNVFPRGLAAASGVV